LKLNAQIKIEPMAPQMMQNIESELRLIAFQALGACSNFSPINTGQLQKSFTSSAAVINTEKMSENLITVTFGTPLWGRPKGYGMYQEFGCFFGETKTKILTKHGWKRLRHVKVGDMVLTHLKRWKEVTQKHCYQAVGSIARYTIKTVRGKITVTGNHPIFTDMGWKRADQLKTGDLIMSFYKDLPRFHWKNF
jgi:hypothetical protein